jgi:cell division protein FtsB
MAVEDRGYWLAPGLTPRRVLIVAALFIVAYFGVLVVSNAITHYQLQHKEEALQAEIVRLERREARLNGVRAYLQTDLFIEAVARESGLVRPGELAVVQVPGGAPGEAASGLRPDDPWWFRYLNQSDRP